MDKDMDKGVKKGAGLVKGSASKTGLTVDVRADAANNIKPRSPAPSPKPLGTPLRGAPSAGSKNLEPYLSPVLSLPAKSSLVTALSTDKGMQGQLSTALSLPAWEWQVSLEELLTAAGLVPEQHPVTVLTAVLVRQEVFDPAESALLPTNRLDSTAIWKQSGWSQKEHAAAALKLAKLRRADALAAKLEALPAQVNTLTALSAAEKAAFKHEVTQLYYTKFILTNELKSIECFEKETAGTPGFEEIDPEERPWTRVSSTGKKPEDVALKEQQQAALLLSHHFADLNATVQAQLSFCNAAAVGTVITRLTPEKLLEDQAAHKQAHLQLLVCLKLASLDKRFGGDVSGYLVEHYRTGSGNMLQLQIRDAPFEAAPGLNRKVTAMNAGAMVVTRHNLRRAQLFWERELQPNLRKFSQIARQLVQSQERRQAFLAAADKAAWFDGQTSLVRS